MWIARWTRFITESFRSPWGRVILLSAYYLLIIAGLVILYGKGRLTPTDFVYQGF
jgi:hypothetical protein